MDPQPGSSPTPTHTSGRAAPQPQAPRPPSYLWVYVVPLFCLVATLGFWLQTRNEIAALHDGQRQVIQALDAARGVPTIDVSGAPALGSEDALLTLVEFSDYECPYCIRHFTQTMPELEAKYINTGKVRYVFRDLPIDQLHPAAIRAHEAGRCAAEQGKFWEMHTKLFSPAGTHTDAALERLATQVGLSIPAFKECLESGRTIPAIREATQVAAQLGANGTPSFFVGMRDPATNQVRVVQAITGAQPFSEFEKVFAAIQATID